MLYWKIEPFLFSVVLFPAQMKAWVQTFLKLYRNKEKNVLGSFYVKHWSYKNIAIRLPNYTFYLFILFYINCTSPVVICLRGTDLSLILILIFSLFILNSVNLRPSWHGWNMWQRMMSPSSKSWFAIWWDVRPQGSPTPRDISVAWIHNHRTQRRSCKYSAVSSVLLLLWSDSNFSPFNENKLKSKWIIGFLHHTIQRWCIFIFDVGIS